MNLNNIDESNQHEVDLAFKTLEFLEKLEIPAEVLPKMRDVLANISDFQFRFAGIDFFILYYVPKTIINFVKSSYGFACGIRQAARHESFLTYTKAYWRLVEI